MDFFEQILLGLTPGRIALILALFAALNLGLWFFLKSRLLDHSQFRSHSLRLNGLLILFVFILLAIVRQPLPQKIIIFTPLFERNDHGQAQATNDWSLAEAFSRNGRALLKKRYLAYRWQWLAEARNRQKEQDIQSYLRYGRLISAEIILLPLKTVSGDSLLIYRQQNPEPVRLAVAALDNSSAFWDQVQRQTGIFRSSKFPESGANQTLLAAELSLTAYQYDSARQLPGLVASPQADELLARIDLAQALSGIKPGSTLSDHQTNPYFKAIRDRLLPYVRERRETPGMALILGKMAMYQDDFTQAEVLIKRALAEDPENSRIYFELSSFLPDRLADLGFNTRREALEKAVKLDPGYYAALLALANDYYQQGSGTPQGFGTTKALEILEQLNLLYPTDPVIKTRLADIFVKIGRFADAHRIFKQILLEYPESADAHYNAGTTCFYQQKFDSALTRFSTAIRLGNHLESYLFKGITFRQTGQRDSALFYFRERVRRKTGDDDRYAKEAMHGIRKILDEIAREEDLIKFRADSLKNLQQATGKP